jgi:methylmalonyl-CoA mutase
VNTPTVDGAALDRSAPDEPEHLILAADFPEAGRDEWSTLVDQVLRRSGRLGADAPAGAGVRALTTTTPDDIAVPPLFTADDATGLAVGVPGRRPFVRGSRPTGGVPAGWDVRQRHAEPDPATVRTAITEDLENGAHSIWLTVGGGGAPVHGLAEALADVALDLAPVVLDAGAVAEPAAEAFLTLAAGRGVADDALLGTLGLDPIGLRARTGAGPAVESVVPLARRIAQAYPHVRAVVVDALPVHAAGGSDAQELGFSLAAGVAYLRALTAAGLPVDTAARLLEFRYAATAEQFPTIAKLRAARRVWARVLEVSGAAPSTPPVVHAVASPAMYTRRDPYVNLLRGTVAGFAAGLGGADAVTVAPFDAAIGASTPFSRRIARNTQSMLIMEAHLGRVIDPAGGSWFVERLTDDLARTGWAFFQHVEAAGGAVAALDSGILAEEIGTVRARREKDVATRRVPVTGVSEFPDLAEAPVARTPRPEHTGGGLPVFRPAGRFEAFRDHSDAVLGATGKRPRIFLATLGPLSAHTARATFARNLLAAGGIDAVEAGPTQTAEDVIAAFAKTGARVAVLCGTDSAYAECATEIVAALRVAGARRVLLAGGTQVDGLDGHLYAGGDALAVIGSVYSGLNDSALQETT